MMPQPLTAKEYLARVGEGEFVSDWIRVGQAEIDAFGRATRDIDPQHMDPAWAAKNSPFGTTILYGFQILSLLTQFTYRQRELFNDTEGHDYNYGLNKVRFISPIPVDARFRDRSTVKSIEEKPGGALLVTSEHVIEVEGVDKPAAIVEWVAYMQRRIKSDER